MITFDLGNTEKASRLAAQAQSALNEGDTARAQSMFREAAKDLERQMSGARKQSDKDMLRFLAASQYYHGGLYTDAQRLCRRVQVSLLSTEVRPIFHKFFRDVNDRADSGYRERIRSDLLRHFQKHESRDILDLLQEHPYVLPSAGVAFMRAVSCEQLRDYKAAALFFSDVMRFAPEASELFFASAAIPNKLMLEGKLDEAWEYVMHQLKIIPHTLTSINASLVRFHQASRTASPDKRRTLSTEQIQHFEDAWRQFQLLPQSLQSNAELRDYMMLCFEAATFGYLRLDRPETARKLCDQIVAVFPNMPEPLRLRDLVTSATSQTIDGVGEDYLKTREGNIGRRRVDTMRALELVGT